MPRFAIMLAMTALVVGASAAGAQVLSGLIRLAPSGAPAARTLVVAVGDEARIVATRQADATGVFALELGQPGKYRLVFVRAGGEAVSTPAFALDSTPYVEREFQIPGDTASRDSVLLAAQVDTPARLRPERNGPRYPDRLAMNAIRGRVRVLFIVDTKGKVEKNSVAVVGATNEEFIEPVIRAIRASHFTPAIKAGQPVRQLSTMTADFGCEGDPVTPGDNVDWVIRSLYPACQVWK